MSPTLQNRPSGTMTGGRALAEMLRLSGAGPMFGMGGFQLLPFYDAVGLVGLNHHLINDERCGAFAADAYARVTNRPGICDGTLGPGATNLVTGLVESLNGGIPIVAITGDTNRMHSWKNMTQECRQVEILRPAVKELIRVEMTARIPELVRRAFAVATSGRPGPVLLDVPEDVAHGTHDFAPEDFVIDEATLKAPARRIRPDRADIERAAKLIAKAKRPLLLTGGGIHLSEAWSALTRFAEAQSIPVAHTMTGKGGIACTNPLSVGLFGRYSRIANDLIEASDCLIVVGCKLGEIATKRFALPPAHIPVIHLDIVAEEIGRCIPAEIALWGDARAGLEDFADALSDSGAAARAARADYVGRGRAAHEGLGRRCRAAAQFARPAGAYGAPLPRAEQDPAGRTRSSSPMAGSPGIGPGCSTTPRGRDGISFRIAASPRSAMGCRAAWALRSPRPTGPSSRSAAMAGST